MEKSNGIRLTPLENWIMDKTSIPEKTSVALKTFQFHKLLETLRYAKIHSKFYKQQLKNIEVDHLESIQDFSDIPFTFPDDIKKNPLDFLCVSPKDVKRIVTINTSGTSGDEKRIFFTEADLEYTIDFFQYGMSCLLDKADRVLILLPGNSYGSIGDLLKKALAKSETECIVHGVLTDLEAVSSSIEEHEITCIVGIPMQVLYLSRLKRDVFQKYIKKVLLSTDYVPDVLIQELSALNNCKVFNHYGMTEMGYGGGVECEALHGYHLREGDLYFEIVNSETGQEVKEGEYGEVVFTTFHRQAMPLIRYRTGDMARFATDPCQCGTFLRTMEKVTGRITNKVVLKYGQEMHLRELDEMILPFHQVVDFHAILIDEDNLSIELILTDCRFFNNIRAEIIKHLHERFGYTLHIDIDWKENDKTPKITNSMSKRKILSGFDEVRLMKNKAPNKEECQAILEKYEVSEAIIKHCEAVRKVVELIYNQIQPFGIKLDKHALFAAAHLHDLARKEKNHAIVGEQIVRELGYAFVGEIIASHIDVKISTDGSINEKELLYLADKLVIEDKICGIEERFNQKLKEYENDPKSKEKIIERLNSSKTILKKVEKLIGKGLRYE